MGTPIYSEMCVPSSVCLTLSRPCLSPTVCYHAVYVTCRLKAAFLANRK
jgi:hypothetical protein